jgi:anti-sigma B factor antagonist
MPRSLEMPKEMDANTMRGLRPVCEEFAACDDDVVLDMSKVEYIDSSGVGAIVFIYKRLLGAGRSFKLQGVAGQPLQLLTYLRLNSILVQ